MNHLTLVNVVLAICGLVIHELFRVKNRHNKEKFSFSYWIKNNVISVVLSLISTLAILLMLEDVTKFLGIVAEDGSMFERMAAFLAGYSNQSLIKNIVSFFKKKKSEE